MSILFRAAAATLVAACFSAHFVAAAARADSTSSKRLEGALIEGVRFAPTVATGERTLALQGHALLRYKVLLKAYVAALYLEPGTNPRRVLADVPKRLEIEYFWGIAAADFATATEQGIGANVGAAELERLRPDIEAFNRFYRDVQPGDRYALTYLPGRGTELALNGTPLGTVPGADFAAAIFSIWLGERPLDSGLKTALLGMEGP